MIKGLFILSFMLILVSCDKENPGQLACNNLVDGAYQFPKLPPNHGMSREEIDKYWDLPEKVAECISTRGLIETVLDYPNLGLMMAGTNPQQGYDALIHSRFRGVRELDTRPDRGTELLGRYKRVDPLGSDPDWEPVDIGAYQFRIYFLEIIFSQYVHLESLSSKEKIELVRFAREVYAKKRSKFENYGVWGLSVSATLLARMMKMDKFSPFLKVYNPQSMAWELVEYYWPTTFEVTEKIYSLSEEYLNHLTM